MYPVGKGFGGAPKGYYRHFFVAVYWYKLEVQGGGDCTLV